MRIKTGELNEEGEPGMFEWDGEVESVVAGPVVVFFTPDPEAANGGVIDPVDLSEADKLPKAKLAELCGVFANGPRDQYPAFALCSEDLGRAIKTASELCARLVTKTVVEKKIVKKTVVIASQEISKDFTLSEHKAEKESYEGAFLEASGALEAASSVEYTKGAESKTGRRRLAGGTSTAHWKLGFESDDKADAAQATVSSPKFAEAVAKESGVEVKPAKATVKVVEVEVSVKTVKVELVDSTTKKPTESKPDTTGKPTESKPDTTGKPTESKPDTTGKPTGSKPTSGVGAGLRIRSPHASIELGSDVKIKRVGDGKLGVDANVHVNGAVNVKKLYIGGLSIEEIVQKLVAEALKNK